MRILFHLFFSTEPEIQLYRISKFQMQVLGFKVDPFKTNKNNNRLPLTSLFHVLSAACPPVSSLLALFLHSSSSQSPLNLESGHLSLALPALLFILTVCEFPRHFNIQPVFLLHISATHSHLQEYFFE